MLLVVSENVEKLSDLATLADGAVGEGSTALTGTAAFYDCLSSSHGYSTSGVLRVVVGQTEIGDVNSSQPSLNAEGSTLVSVDSESVNIFADILAAFPLYYCTVNDVHIISSRLSTIRALVSPRLDHTGILQFLHDGYYVGHRTCFENVKRVCAGEHIQIGLRTGVVRVTDTSRLWAESTENLNSAQLDEIIDSIITASRCGNAIMLMASGGWDSRTLLAVSLASQSSAIKQLYCHGSVNSREARIVGDLAASARLPVYLKPITEEILSQEATSRYARYDENLVFPHWHDAGDSAVSLQCSSVMAGVYGEVLGGHYGPPMLMRNARRMAAVLSYCAFPETTDKVLRYTAPTQSGVHQDRFAHKLKTKPWYLVRGAHDAWKYEYNEDTEKDVETMVGRYQKRGICSPASLYEAFITEHRGVQYIGAQLRAARRPGTRIVAPFGSRRVLELAARIPFYEKVHNKVNRRIIARCAPELLEPPHASALTSAKHSIFLQECSRTLRKVMEGGQHAAHEVTRGAMRAPNLSWVEFSRFSESNVLGDLVGRLHADFWDRDGMYGFLDSLTKANAHPAFDMCNKIVTIDRIVSGDG